MNKEPIGLYIFRFVMGLAILSFMGMLYWSSVLVEDHLQNLRADVADLKNDLYDVRVETDRIRDDVLKALVGGRVQGASASQGEAGRQHMDSSLPNLLAEDPFYTDTLPSLLGGDFKPRGTLKGATIGRPNNLHPFSNWSQVSGWVSQCSVTLARLQFGKYETFAPDMAVKIEARKGQDGVDEYWVHLRDDVYWQPLRATFFSENIKLAPHFLRKHQVTAADYKFFFDALMNPHFQEAGAVSLRNYLGDIDELEVIDPLTFVVRWKAHEVVDDAGNEVSRIKYAAKLLTGGLRPLPGFVYKYFADGSKIVEDDADPATYRTNSVWAQNFTEHWAKNIIVSCGGWIFEQMTDKEIRFRRNPDHYFPYDVLVEKMRVKFKNTLDSVWQAFKSNALDTYNLQPDQLIEWDTFRETDLYRQQEQGGNSINRLDYPGRSYVYVGWNQAKPYFRSQKVRLAMTLAIDRNRIIQQYLNGMGIPITGPFAQDSSAYDDSIEPWPFDLQRARQLLEEEGWIDRDGDGVREKEVNGKRIPFEFSLTYYVKNPTTKAICEYIAGAMKELRIRCRLNGVDIADLSAVFDEKSFDALCLGWALGTPPEDPRQLWYSGGVREQGSSNAVGFANVEADEIIEALTFETNPERRRALYYRFHSIIHEEQPYTFLYAPKTALLYRAYLQNVFIPVEKQSLIPGADIAQPQSAAFWIKKRK